MDRRDQDFGVVHAEGIHLRAVGFAQARTAQGAGRVGLERAVPIAEVKRAPQHAECVVVGLLAPGMFVRDCNQLGVDHVVEKVPAEPGPPDAVENLAIPAQGRGGQIVTPDTCFAVGEVFVEGPRCTTEP